MAKRSTKVRKKGAEKTGNHCLMRAYYVSGTTQGAGDAAVNQKASARPHGATDLMLKCMYQVLRILAPKEDISQLI